ncbi:MAG: hypothetical protein RL282_246, partial [Bacteroidota bacterium]
IFFSLLLIGISSQLLQAQHDVNTVLKSFPYQQSTSADAALTSMKGWSKSDWKKFFVILDDAKQNLSATYALSAYIHLAATDPVEKAKAAKALTTGLSATKSAAAQDLLMEMCGYLGDEKLVKMLTRRQKDPQYAVRATLALGTIRNGAAWSANSSSTAPHTITVEGKYISPAQVLLNIQDRLKAAKDPVEKRKALYALEGVKGFPALMVTAQYLDDPILKKQAALIMARNALQDKTLRGNAPRAALEKALPLISGVDSAVLAKGLKNYLKALPYDNGWELLFNGKNLDGWKGLVGNPISRAKMSADSLLKAEAVANVNAQSDWVVEDGLLIFTGHGDNLCTKKMYGDFEMYVDWKITAKGDAGIYLRGSPQVQIWDTSRREVGAQVGSGGLYNNQKNQSKPTAVLDNKIGEWNTFHIIMKGERVTVYLNGQKVTDNVVLENYWDRKIPIFPKEAIELQAHGTYVAYRNIYVRELPADDMTTPLSEEEKKEGFESLFDGSNLDKWIGNKKGYALEEGVIVTHPELGGGNIYTADEYADFEYRFDFQLTPAANNGLGIRTPTQGDAAYVGMELQILDNEADVYKSLKPYQYHGSVYGVIPSKRGYLKPTGQWNQQTVIAKGNKIKVILNGQVILDGDISSSIANGTADGNKHPGLANKTGHIGFLGHGDVVRFRNIRIKRL